MTREERSHQATILFQRHMDKLVSEKLGTLKNEFPLQQVVGSDRITEAEILLEMIDVAAKRFVITMRGRIERERAALAAPPIDPPTSIVINL